MKKLKERIKITETVVEDGNYSLVYGQKIIMDNQIAIMDALLENQQNMEILMIRTK